MAEKTPEALLARARDLQNGIPLETTSHLDRIIKHAGVTGISGLSLMSICSDFGEPAEVVAAVGKVRPLLDID